MNKLIFICSFCLDMLLIPSAFSLAYRIKFSLAVMPEPYIILSLVATLVWMISFSFYGVYRQRVGPLHIVDTILVGVKGSIIAGVQLMALSFLIPQLPESRAVIAYASLLCIVSTSSVRIVLWKLEQWPWFRLRHHKKAIVIGGGDAEQMVIETLLQQPSYCIHYIGSISDTVPTQFRYRINDHYKNLGPISNIIQLLDAYKPDIIYITNPALALPYTQLLKSHTSTLHVVANTSVFQQVPVQACSMDSLTFLHTHPVRNTPIQNAIKELLDRSLALFLLIVLAPLMLLISIGIYISSPGAIFFTQERLTQTMRPFIIIKFRTMVLDAEATTGPVCVVGNDPRVFAFGAILRRLSLDELPQLLNIISGDMSFVGPRPERPHFVNIYKKETPHFTERFHVKAGLTGWAQVNGRSYLTPHPNLKLHYDLYYIYNWSLLLDFKIILKTFLVVFKQEAVH
tara:strand:+ start:146 stop:1513 length:1368 start_codon:yes stop_codon:yes gene_type:complete